MTFFIILVIAAIVYWAVKAQKKEQQEKQEAEELRQQLVTAFEELSAAHPDEMETYIAGAQYHDGVEGAGFIGYTRREPDNPHDPRAVAIYDNEHRHVGYIPRKDLDEYYESAKSDSDEYVCMGFIGGPCDTACTVIFAKSEDVPIRLLLYDAREMVEVHGTEAYPVNLKVPGIDPSADADTLLAQIDAFIALDDEGRLSLRRP